MSEQDNPLAVNAALLAPSVKEPTLQRMCACGNHTIAGGDCESCRKEKESATLQRAETSSAEVGAVPPVVNEVLDSPGQPLDDESRSFFEPRFGRDFSRVRVHTDAKAHESAQAVNAKAYTVGQDLVFKEGQFTPGSSSGKKLLAHELAHVAQQSGSTNQSHSGLRVGAAGSPAEAQADAASDAVVKGNGPANISPAPAMISRTPDEPAKTIPDLIKIDPSTLFAPAPREPYSIKKMEQITPDQVRVFISTGQRYLITRTSKKDVVVTPGVGKPGLSARPGVDRQNVWLDINFCEGATEGTVRIGADIPDQVLKAIISNVTSGGDIGAAVRNMKFTPFAEANVQVRSWNISAKAQATVDTEGKPQGAQTTVKVEKDTDIGRVAGKVVVGSQKVGDDPLGGLTATVGFEWTPFAKAKKIPNCKERNVKVVEEISYRCDEETTVPARDVPKTREVPKEDQRDLYLYFVYARPQLDSSSAANLSKLKDLLGQGYRVTLVEGYTSPEGPAGSAEAVKPQQYKGGKYNFKDNYQLSQDRAEAAVRAINGLCTDASGSCFASGKSGEEGKGELYQLRKLGKEVEGSEQVKEATDKFKTTTEEAPHRTPDVERRLDRARTSQERADIVYPLLRRALIRLRRQWKETEHYKEHIPESTAKREVFPCPDKLKNAAFPETKSGGQVGPRR